MPRRVWLYKEKCPRDLQSKWSSSKGSVGSFIHVNIATVVREKGVCQFITVLEFTIRFSVGLFMDTPSKESLEYNEL